MYTYQRYNTGMCLLLYIYIHVYMYMYDTCELTRSHMTSQMFCALTQVKGSSRERVDRDRGAIRLLLTVKGVGLRHVAQRVNGIKL